MPTNVAPGRLYRQDTVYSFLTLKSTNPMRILLFLLLLSPALLPAQSRTFSMSTDERGRYTYTWNDTGEQLSHAELQQMGLPAREPSPMATSRTAFTLGGVCLGLSILSQDIFTAGPDLSAEQLQQRSQWARGTRIGLAVAGTALIAVGAGMLPDVQPVASDAGVGISIRIK